MRRKIASWHRTLLCTLAILAFAGAAAMADVPTSPLLYGGYVTFQGNLPYAVLQWYGNDSSNWDNNSYHVYQTSGHDTTATFTLVATITDTTIRGYYSAQLAPGVYTFYVTAFNDSGESARSGYVSLEIPSIYVTVDPDFVIDSILVGTPYTYTVNGSASDTLPVRYQIVSPESGMTIDSVTGEFSWTPTYPNHYSIRVRVYSPTEPTAEAFLTIALAVFSPPPTLCATLYGSVSYSDDTPVLSGTVMAIPGDSISGYTPTASIVNGSYQLSVEGDISYRIQVSGGDFYSETTSTSYSVLCHDADTVPLIYVRRYPQHRYDSVEGHVHRLADNSPVAATVMFYRDSLGGVYHSTHTDQYGNYSIVLNRETDSALYYVRAIPNDNDLYDQYYDHSSTAVGATPIWISGYRVGVNFDLEEREVYTNSLSGSLVNGDSIPLRGTVVAYVIEMDDSIPHIEYANQTSVSSGSFYFGGLEPGTYILFGMSGDSDTYAPGYYLEGDFAAHNWEEGTQITVTTGSNDSLLVIKLDSINGSEGRNMLRGEITGDAGVAGRQGHTLQGSKPLAGANVYAVDANDRISGFTTTDQDGRFLIDGLGVGVYRIEVDKLGYKGSVSTITFDEDNSEAELPEVTLQHVGSISSVPVVAGGASNLAIYPNPARGSVNLSFTATYGEVRVTMTNAAGVEVRSSRVATVDGANTVRLETSDLGSGLYFVRVAGARGISTIPVTIVR